MEKKTYAEKRFFEWHEDDKSVTLRNKGGSYGGGSEVLVVSYQDKVGTLSPGAHAGSYNGQDAYNDMLVTEKRNGIFTSEVRAIQTERQGISPQTEGLQGLDRPHSEGGVQHNE